MTAIVPVVLACPAGDPLTLATAAALEEAGVSATVVGLDAALEDDGPHEARFREALLGVVGGPSALGESVIGGFSLGGRIAAKLCPEVGPRGLLCFGYPFHSARAPTQRRGLEALSRLRLPVRIIQGTRDNHGTEAEVRGYRLPDTVEMVWMHDGNHRLVPRERSGHTYKEHIDAAAEAALSFVLSIGRSQ